MKNLKQLFLWKGVPALIFILAILIFSKIVALTLGHPVNHKDVYIAIGLMLTGDIAFAFSNPRTVYRAAVAKIEKRVESVEQEFKQDLVVAKQKWQAEEAALLDHHVSSLFKL